MKTSNKREFKALNIILMGVCLTLISLSFSCSKDDTPACEQDNTGVIIVENPRSTGVVKVFFNETGSISVNGPGDLDVSPGEKESMQLPAGVHNVQARLSITNCEGGRCLTTVSNLPEKEVDLDACENANLIY